MSESSDAIVLRRANKHHKATSCSLDIVLKLEVYFTKHAMPRSILFGIYEVSVKDYVFVVSCLFFCYYLSDSIFWKKIGIGI